VQNVSIFLILCVNTYIKDLADTFQFCQAFGRVAVENDTPLLQTDATFWLASCTKLMTAVAIMQCVERGLIELDVDIASVLPEWTGPEILMGFDEETGLPIIRKSSKCITLRLAVFISE
jgi:hypothetical protein